MPPPADGGGWWGDGSTSTKGPATDPHSYADGTYQVKLTVTHHGVEPGSLVRQSISDGWPLKLSCLKSELERVAPPPR